MRTLPLLLLLAACTTAPDAACRLDRVAELPLEVVGNVPVLTAEINGRPARLALDTGSNRTVLTHAAAARLDLVDTPGTDQIRAAGGLARAGSAIVDRLVLGPVRIDRLPVLTTGAPAPPLDGLVGIDVLIAYELDLDIPDRRATLYRARPCPDAQPAWPGRAIRLPVQQQGGSGHLFLPVMIDGQPLRGILDSGASRTILSIQAAADAGITRRRLDNLPVQRGQSVNPEGVLVRTVRFRELRVGRDVLPDPVLTITDLPTFAGDLLLGGDYIATRRLWLSFRLGQAFVEGR